MRMRRLRRSEQMRALVRETTLEPGDLIYPLFICPGEGVRKEVGSMPGVFNLSVDQAVREAEEAAALGVGGLLLFGLPASKDEQGTGAWTESALCSNPCVHCANRAQQRSWFSSPTYASASTQVTATAASSSRDATASKLTTIPLLICLLVRRSALPRPAPTWWPQATLMDGRVAAIRAALDSEGHAQTPILSYASKFASAFYGPFREAADSAPQFGDRRAYQMDGANLRLKAMREIELDLEEGADMILMKPAMPYLDVVRAARERFGVPIGAYQVSGEYSMLQAAIQRGWLDRDRAILESLIGIRRAGADFAISYFAKEAAKLLA